MKNRITAILCSAIMALSILSGCGSTSVSSASSGSAADVSVSSGSVSDESVSASSQSETAESVTAASSESVSGVSSDSSSASSFTPAPIPDGTYTATFHTDSYMFHVNEANDEKGTLTVKDGKMTIHVSLMGIGILNLYVGTIAEAKEHEDDLLEPTVDTVTYDDGTTDEVYGFDIPVPYLDDDFQIAIIGRKGKWYQHTVSVTDPVSSDGETVQSAS